MLSHAPKGVLDGSFADVNCRISADIFMATNSTSFTETWVFLNYILLAVFLSMQYLRVFLCLVGLFRGH